MREPLLREILILCISLEKTAEKIYSEISERTTIPEHKGFWKELARDEQSHEKFWERLISLEAEKPFSFLFDQPTKIKAELDDMLVIIKNILAEVKKTSFEISQALLVAFQIETLMLNPNFFIFFRELRQLDIGSTFEENYGKHIAKFSKFAKNLPDKKPEMEFIGEILSKMWRYTKEIADQFDQIKTLKGLIPICANCKKVRDDRGYWNEIESYVRKYSTAPFSHGVCPDCEKELYSEFLG